MKRRNKEKSEESGEKKEVKVRKRDKKRYIETMYIHPF